MLGTCELRVLRCVHCVALRCVALRCARVLRTCALYLLLLCEVY